MADKEKRLRKILLKANLKGQLKPVNTLEKAHLVLVDYPEESTKYAIFNKEMYQRVLANRYTYPEDRVYFLVPTNPRNRRQLEQSLTTNKYGSLRMSAK